MGQNKQVAPLGLGMFRGRLSIIRSFLRNYRCEGRTTTGRYCGVGAGWRWSGWVERVWRFRRREWGRRFLGVCQ